MGYHGNAVRYLKDKGCKKFQHSWAEMVVLLSRKSGIPLDPNRSPRTNGKLILQQLGLGVEKKPKKKKTGLDVNSEAFLRGFEWRKLRMQALKQHGGRCQCCGQSAKDGIVLHVDHIKPRRKYPELALELGNLQVLCEECNHGKGNWDETDWRGEP